MPTVDDVLIRSATPADAPSIVDLFCDGFGPTGRALTIYGCTGAAQFVADQVAVPRGLADTLYTVAESRARVVGCVELRCLADALFLNYICLDGKARRQGLAARLLWTAITEARRPFHQRMHLDVVVDNAVALGWYQRLGFTHEWIIEWWTSPLPEGGATGRSSGLPQARLCHARYGFSNFKVVTGRATYEVGLLGDEWFRVVDPELLADREALAAMALIDGCRQFFGIFRAGALRAGLLPSGGSLVRSSFRMSAPLDHLMGGLSRKAR